MKTAGYTVDLTDPRAPERPRRANVVSGVTRFLVLAPRRGRVFLSFSLVDHWVWDLWLADDGQRFHLYYLRAPKALGDPALRHRNATIGHASSVDLISWTDEGVALVPGEVGSADHSATWTGSVVQGPQRLWWMFYGGSVFLSETVYRNIETICVATSSDLYSWAKRDVRIAADPRWYETIDDGSWHEEAWRDPWVFWDEASSLWHMLITARAVGATGRDRGVIGHATSRDLTSWEVQPPLSAPGAGFAHLEVPQVQVVNGRPVLLFSCDTKHLDGGRAANGEVGGIWAVAAESTTGPFHPEDAVLLAPDSDLS